MKPTRNARLSPNVWRVALSLVLVPLVVVLVPWGWWPGPGGCRGFSFFPILSDTSFEYHTATASFECVVGSSKARELLLVTAGMTALAGLSMWWLLRTWWSTAWRTRPMNALKGFTALPALSAGFLVSALLVARATTVYVPVLGFPSDTSVSGWRLSFRELLAWPGLLLGVASIGLFVVTLAAAMGSIRLRPAGPLPDGEVQTAPPDPKGVGICVSGGGIRAASVALGALWTLEQTPVDGALKPVSTPAHHDSILENARFLASVSGGGYTAGAYRIARGTALVRADVWPNGVFGAGTEVLPADLSRDIDDPDSAGKPHDLRRHIISRRRYLQGGKGIVNSSFSIIFGAIVHALLVVLVAFLVGWPLGRLVSNWPLVAFEVVELRSELVEWNSAVAAWKQAGSIGPEPLLFEREFEVQELQDLIAEAERLELAELVAEANTMIEQRTPAEFSTEPSSTAWLATLGGLWVGFAMVALPAAWFTWKRLRWQTAKRRLIRQRALTLVAIAAAIVAVHTIVPGAVVLVPIGGLDTQTSLLLAALIVPVAGLADKWLPGFLRVGRFVLPTLMLYLILVMASESRTDSGGQFDRQASITDFTIWLGVLLMTWFLADPRWWSPFEMYRDRLTGSFGLTTEEDHRIEEHPWTSEPQIGAYPIDPGREPLLHEYVGAPGPTPLVCASVARDRSDSTGVRALSFVLSPSEVAFYDVRRTGEKTTTTKYSCDTAEYLDAMDEGRARAVGTMTAAMALSGAAVSSSMGRLSLGMADSLLALFNIRLGAWLPNPRYLPSTTGQRFKRSRLSGLMKEVTGSFDIDDPNLYITDGGHRENLGLVELIRRRCRVIICIDASDDEPGKFTTFMRAVRLAQIECAATVEFIDENDVNLLDELRADAPLGMAASCAVKMSITYDESPNDRSVLIYAKSVVEKNDRQLTAFSEEEPMFPLYSTANQFLTEDQAVMLVRLGNRMAARVVERGLDDIREAILTDRSTPG